MFHVKQFFNSFGYSNEKMTQVGDFYVGLDALTVISTTPKSAKNFGRIAGDFIELQVSSGERPNHWRVHQYEGRKWGSFGVASHEDKVLVAVTGPMTESVAAVMAEESCRATRIDCQTTFNYAQPQLDYASVLYSYLKEGKGSDIRKLSLKFYESKNGQTLYLGSRTSSVMGRVYDKSVDYFKPLGNTWRCELEFKGDLANEAWKAWVQEEDREEALKSELDYRFFRWGISLPFNTSRTRGAMAPPAEIKSRDKYLEWMRNSVAPVVRDLQGIVDDDILLEALGISQGRLF
jgi:hypothetical protein